VKRLALILAVTLLSSALASAHGNLAHVMGTVIKMDDHSVSVKTTDGSIKIVAVDDETKILKGESPATLKDITIGCRVVIHAHVHGDKLHAAEIKIGTNSAAAPVKHS
jgi:hypothetical protein